MKCESCGAIIKLSSNTKVVECQYCGTYNTVHFTDKIPILKNQSYKTSVSIIFFIIFVIGVSIFSRIVAFGGGGFFEWYSTVHLINSNNDDVLDIVGLTGAPASYQRIAIVDGVTGDVLHKKPKKYKISEAPEIYCPTEDYVCVVETDMVLRILSAKDLAEIGSISLPDKIKNTRCLNNTFYIKFYDDSQFAIDLKTAKKKPGNINIPLEQADYSKAYFDKQTDNNGVVYYATEKSNVTELIVVTAKQNNDTIWQTSLRYKNVLIIDNPCLLQTENTVITYGSQLGDRDYAYIIGLDKTDGMIRYEIKQNSTWSTDLSGFNFNNKYVIACWGFGLHAYDPNTGERKWNIGGR